MIRKVSLLLLAALALMAAGCSSSKPATNNNSSGGNSGAPATPNIAGPWEFTLVSSNGTQTGIEVALQEGKTLVNGGSEPDGEVSASGTQMMFVTFNPGAGVTATHVVDSFTGICNATSGTDNGVTGTIAALGGNFSGFRFTANGSVFSVSAALSGDGSSIQGTYQSVDPTSCQDSGTFTGVAVPKLLSETYTGKLTLPTCPSSGCDSAVASISENSSGNASLNFDLSGSLPGALSLSGPVVGNAFQVQGTFQGQTLVLYGYYEVPGSLPSLYLVNAAEPSQSAGTLTEQQIP